MITDQLYMHDEPVTTVTYYNQNYNPNSPEEREKWFKKCAEELEKAKNIFNVGDTISTKNHPTGILTIMEFIENVQDMQKYNGEPCVVRAKNLNYASSNALQYAMTEFNMASHKKLVTKETQNVQAN